MRINNLNKSFKDKKIYTNTSINLENSGIHVLYGPSGSGKSTLINILLGIDKDNNIDYLVNNKKLESKEIDKFRQANIGYMSQNLGIIDQFNVYQNIKLYDESISDKVIDQILETLDIKDLKEEKGKNLSGGQRQRVRLARSLIHDKKIIIMDEPTNNLDDTNVEVILNILKKLSTDKVLIIATHDKRVIDNADYIHKIENNKINTQNLNNEQSEVKYNDKTEYKFNYIKYCFETLKSLFMVKSIPIFLMVFGVLGLFVFLSGLNKEKSMYEDHLLNLQPGLIFVTPESMENSDGVYINKEKTNSLLNEDQIEKLKENPDIFNVYIRNTVLTEDKNLQKYIANSQNIISDENLENYYTKVSNTNSSKANIENNEIYYYLYEALPYDMFSKGITSLEESYVEIIKGDYPKDNTNEVIIPATLALGYKDETNIIGQSFNYNNNEYIVSGVYDDLKYINKAEKETISFDYYSSKVQNKIYFAYKDKDIPTTEQLKTHYNENQSSFTNSGINNYEEFTKNYQDGIQQLIVYYDLQKDKDVYEYIDDLSLEQDSRYTMYLRHQDDFKEISNKKIVSMLILFIIFLLFFGLIYKYRYAFRQEEFNTLFDNGLLPKEIMILLIFESIIDAIIVGTLAFILLIFINLCSITFGIQGLMIDWIDFIQISIFVLLSLIIINIVNLFSSLKKRGK